MSLGEGYSVTAESTVGISMSGVRRIFGIIMETRLTLV